MFYVSLCDHLAFLEPLGIIKSHEEQSYSWQSKERMYAKNWNV